MKGSAPLLLRSAVVVAACLGGGLLALCGDAGARSASTSFERGEIIVIGSSVREFRPDGTFSKIIEPRLDGGVGGGVGGSGYLYVASSAPIVRKYNPDGSSHGWFGAFPDPLTPSAATTAGDDVFVAISDDQFLHELYRFDMNGRTPQPTMLQARATAVDVAADGCTAVYATRSRGIKRVNVCTGRPLADVIPLIGADDVRLLPDATLLVSKASGADIVHYAAGGAILGRYRAGGVAGWNAVDLAPDATSFWALTSGGSLYRFDLGSGAVLQGPIDTGADAADLAVVGAPPGTAPSAAGPPPSEGVDLDGVATLTGEAFSGVTDAPRQPPFSCADDASTIEIESGGYPAAVGPYPGTFVAQASATIGPQTIFRPSGIFGVSVGQAQKLSGTFAIRAGDDRVAGTVELGEPASENTGACTIFSQRRFPLSPLVPPELPINGYFRDLYGRQLTYTAQIVHRGRVYTDRGDASLFTDQFYWETVQGVFGGSAHRWIQSFVSRLASVSDPFSVGRKQQQHSAGVPATTKLLTITVRWKRKGDIFVITGVKLVGRRRLEGGIKLKPGKLKITARHGDRFVAVDVSNLQAGRVVFEVQAKRTGGPTEVETSVSGSS